MRRLVRSVPFALIILLVLVTPAFAASVSLTNYVFTPKVTKIGLGSTVTWTNDTSGTLHTTTSNGVSDGDGTTGIALWTSGTLNPGQSFTFTFRAAGSFPYHCSFHIALGMKGSVKVPVKVSPASGTTGTTFTITWATAAPPSGDVFDVQIKRPGTTSFVDWTGHTGITAQSGTFKPGSGSGTYSFRARLRNSTMNAASGYSPAGSISVS